jgi:hypothetical protein
MGFTAPIFMKRVSATRHEAQIFRIDFHSNRSRNMEVTRRNQFAPVSKSAIASIFTKPMMSRQIFAHNAYAKIHKNPSYQITDGYTARTHARTHARSPPTAFFLSLLRKGRLRRKRPNVRATSDMWSLTSNSVF